MSRLRLYLRIFTCIGLANLGYILIWTARVYFIEQYYCHQLHPLGPDGVLPVCINDTDVQAALAKTTGLYDALASVPGLILTAPYAMTTSKDKKWAVIRLGVLGQVLAAIFLSLVVIWSSVIGISWILLAPLFDIFGGGIMVSLSLIYSTLAEDVDPDELSALLFRLMAFEMTCGFLATLLASQLLRYSPWLLVTIGILTIGLGIPMTYLSKPDRVEISVEDVKETIDGYVDDAAVEGCDIAGTRASGVYSTDSLQDQCYDTSTPLLGHPAKPHSFWHALVYSYKAFWDIIKGDALMFNTVLIAFLNSWSVSIQVIFVPWASQAYAWSVADSTSLQAGSFAISSVALLAFRWVEQKVRGHDDHQQQIPGTERRRPVDLWATKTSLIISAVGICAVGMSTTSTSYIGAMCFYSLGAGVRVGLQSFASSTVNLNGASSTNLNVVFTGIAMAMSVGDILGKACWSQVFSWLAQRGQGISPAVEYLYCGLVLVAALVITWRLEALSARRNGG